MNQTTLEHILIAVSIQLIIGLLTGNWWAGAAAGSFLFIGREHAQAESRWISLFGNHKRINMPWYGGFDKRVWTHLDSWCDWVAPTLAVVGVACYFQFGS
jgi:hypothetical protein